VCRLIDGYLATFPKLYSYLDTSNFGYIDGYSHNVTVTAKNRNVKKLRSE